MKRYHTWPIVGEQNNGHHTFNMLAMLFVLHPNPSMELVKAITFHDSAEFLIGDAPSPVLTKFPELGFQYHLTQNAILRRHFGLVLANLSNEDRHWLEALDKLEAMIFGYTQVGLGNKNGEPIMDNVHNWFRTRFLEDGIPGPLMFYFNFLVEKMSDSE